MIAHKIPFLDLQATYLELKPELDAAVGRVLSSGWYLLGTEIAAFEQEYAAFTGSKHCIGVANVLALATKCSSRATHTLQPGWP
jgi:dTDP-4-amino-4,6-dideoxygalactose transaminase